MLIIPAASCGHSNEKQRIKMKDKESNINIATINGRVGYGGAINRLVQWTEILSQRKYNIHIVTRILDNKFLDDNDKYIIECIKKLDNICKSFECIYNSKFLQKIYPKETIKKINKWLNISYDLLISFDRRNKREIRKNKNSLKEVYNFITGYTIFLKDFFSRHNIDYFVGYLDDTLFNTIPIFVAKKMDIPRILIGVGRFPKNGTIFCKNDFSNIYIWNNANDANWKEIISMYENIDLVGEGRTTAEKFFKIPDVGYAIKNLMPRKKQIQISPYEKYTLPKIFSINNIIEPIVSEIRKKFNKSYFQAPDYSETYFFMPLHYIDDAQITFREPFADQIKLVHIISKVLPIGIKLYVRPHPHYQASDVEISNMSKISRLENVKIIDTNISVYDLIKHSIGIFTINSTTGFEALIFNKAVITFGHDFYCRKDLCYVVNDINKLPKYVMEVINNNGRPPCEFEYIKNFIQTVYKNTFFASKSYMGVGYGEKYFSEEEAKKFANIIDKIIKMENTGNVKTIGSKEILFS